MELIDVHCHLESPEFSSSLDKIISDASEAGIIKLVTSSITLDQWEVSRRLYQKYDNVEFTIGVHPWHVKESDLSVYSRLEENIDSGAIGIGEIGLDRKIETPGFELQSEVFMEQMKFAAERDLPVIIHCRGAFNELTASLKKTGIPRRGGIIHAFSGSGEIAEELMEMGLSFSMGGALTYRNSRKRSEVLKKIFPGHFLLETDSPDIPPAGIERPNVPSNILLNLEAAADILGLSMEKIAEAATENAKRIFRFS